MINTWLLFIFLSAYQFWTKELGGLRVHDFKHYIKGYLRTLQKVQSYLFHMDVAFENGAHHLDALA